MNVQPNIIPKRSLSSLAGESQKSTLINLSEDFANAERPSQREISKFREMFYVLILRTTNEERKQIGQFLSKSYFTPRPIAIYFGMEEIDVASSFLLFSPVLKNSDLQQIIEKRQFEHASVIARRVGLDLVTVKALLNKDDSERAIQSILKQNAGITMDKEISDLLRTQDTTPTKRVHTPKVVDTADIKITRPDEPETSKPVTNSIHAKLVQRLTDINVEKAPVLKDRFEDLLSVSRMSQSDDTAINSHIIAKNSSFARQVISSARDKNLAELASIITLKTGLDNDYLLEIFENQNTGAQACLFKALSFRKSEVSTLLLLLNKNIGKSLKVFKLVQAKLEQMSIPECREMFIAKGASFNTIEPSTKIRPKHESHFTAALAARLRSASAESTPRQETQIIGLQESA